MSLLDGKHATGCDGQEFASVETAPWGDGFAVIHEVWCGDCGAADWQLLDTAEPEGRQ